MFSLKKLYLMIYNQKILMNYIYRCVKHVNSMETKMTESGVKPSHLTPDGMQNTIKRGVLSLLIEV
jgi:L-lysine 2,3-aminomutase